MALAAERLLTGIREGTISHPDDETLNSHVLNAALRPAGAELYRFDKPKSKRCIDGCIALAMVHSVAVAGASSGPPLFAFA